MGFGGLQSSVNPPASTYLKPAVPGSHPKHTIYAISTQSQILYYICHFVEEWKKYTKTCRVWPILKNWQLQPLQQRNA